jgi:type I restriction enzyme S subunit
MALVDTLEKAQTEKAVVRSRLSKASFSELANAQNASDFADNWQRLSRHFNELVKTQQDVQTLRQTILQLAVQGKLTEQRAEDGDAREELEGITIEKEFLLELGKVRKIKDLPPIELEDIPFELPSNWLWTRLNWISEAIEPNPSHRMPRYVEKGIPFISTENFAENDKLNFNIGKKVMQKTLDEQIQRFEVLPGTFAFSRIGTIGKTRPLPLERNYCLSHALSVISPFSTKLDSFYLRFSLTTDAVLDQAHQGVKSIGVPDLGMGTIRMFLIPLPPLAEQKRIVARVDSLMAICDRLEGLLVQRESTAEKLVGAVVQGLAA